MSHTLPVDSKGAGKSNLLEWAESYVKRLQEQSTAAGLYMNGGANIELLMIAQAIIKDSAPRKANK